MCIGTLVSMYRLLSVGVDGISTHTLVLTLQSASFPLAELWHNSFSHNSVVSYATITITQWCIFQGGELNEITQWCIFQGGELYEITQWCIFQAGELYKTTQWCIFQAGKLYKITQWCIFQGGAGYTR